MEYISKDSDVNQNARAKLFFFSSHISGEKIIQNQGQRLVFALLSLLADAGSTVCVEIDKKNCRS